jgi:hypothetical protein
MFAVHGHNAEWLEERSELTPRPEYTEFFHRPRRTQIWKYNLGTP